MQGNINVRLKIISKLKALNPSPELVEGWRWVWGEVNQ